MNLTISVGLLKICLAAVMRKGNFADRGVDCETVKQVNVTKTIYRSKIGLVGMAMFACRSGIGVVHCF